MDTIHIKAIVESFSVLPYIVPYKVLRTFESVDEILKSGSQRGGREVFGALEP